MILRFFLPLIFLLSNANGAFGDDGGIWLLVETNSKQLKVMQGEEAKEVFTGIAIGSRGTGFDKKRNDKKTPLGEYRIGWINENSKFHRFYGLTYPNLDNAKRAFGGGLIGENTFRSIMRASLADDIPPQNTELGGQIGIHGIGAADRRIHENFDWTSGCIALTDEQIDRLNQWVRKGTLVVIR